jgi:hypothetical protein
MTVQKQKQKKLSLPLLLGYEVLPHNTGCEYTQTTNKHGKIMQRATK